MRPSGSSARSVATVSRVASQLQHADDVRGHVAVAARVAAATWRRRRPPRGGPRVRFPREKADIIAMMHMKNAVRAARPDQAHMRTRAPATPSARHGMLRSPMPRMKMILIVFYDHNDNSKSGDSNNNLNRSQSVIISESVVVITASGAGAESSHNTKSALGWPRRASSTRRS